MLWAAASYPDYFLQLSALLRDPVYRGRNVPGGHGEAILLIPGFLCGDWLLGTMAGWLNRLGYRAYLSGIDWNIECPNRTGELLGWRLDYITQETGSPIIVVGHSLGGMLARFLGATYPERVRHVIALGSPIDGSLRLDPLLSWAFRTLQTFPRPGGRSSPECARSRRCGCQFAQTAFAPLPEGVGFTAVFSKQDEVVDWHTCLDLHGENWQVSGRHMGLVVNRGVYRIIADTLAACRQGGTRQRV
jgi:triacylglycerol lipase